MHEKGSCRPEQGCVLLVSCAHWARSGVTLEGVVFKSVLISNHAQMCEGHGVVQRGGRAGPVLKRNTGGYEDEHWAPGVGDRVLQAGRAEL